MNNFTYYVPVRIHFGKGEISKLHDEITSIGKNVLLVYGGGSIKRIGVYDQVIEQLKDCNVFELGGVDPNPRLKSVEDGALICKENHIDVVLAVGGGSSIDCAKAICAAAYYDGNPWDFIVDSSLIKKALPLVSVLTLSATGSEMDNTAVITNPQTKDKRGFGSRHLFPKVSILDPTYTYSVSKYQTASGVADIMSHTFETYFNDTKDAYLSNEIAISILKTCIKYGKVVYDEPDNYEARANLMWASSLAINGLISCGCGKSWSCHPMEHVLSAYYDVTHGAGLAMLTPKWMTYILDDSTVDKFAEYGIEVWGIDASLPPMEIAKTAIANTEAFFHSLDLPSTFEEIGIPDTSTLEEMAQMAVDSKGGTIKGYRKLEFQDVVNIYHMCQGK
ncbi:alcohol dehydrogenase YqhD (iron-dependent ADH family) [Breznakia sp. PF5-3]|uniref:iron-containing alcohol dehydrogenase n=1 Tax=unclassified Breznakia TaxID=2623764 RepID=UPI0024069E69|nr:MULTISPECIES: iron-containing alcohol dehydrogenase [unclassified Breznakia]MDF9824219.1 alcohol dehydrogenase YqhD (iron-dependent ADH family) [Breznakia sp. PM6-1]MDF9835017.1 alcohol dehydrogenase YqhD (iron-dependent ADH family) [Breznakia sp. PF5-3]MDF9837262.1 alcohol dehydrogenase YqhD (iron-dependent ADH family) [Breznakia sp. PFB2-8]MDF9859252.1 alcohol dehydrogenase YqhD (iron-dependent ADH family) [Breznakia sp. PH5-24]